MLISRQIKIEKNKKIKTFEERIVSGKNNNKKKFQKESTQKAHHPQKF